MNRSLSAVLLCTSILIVVSFLVVTTSRAKEDVLTVLLDLPAPPPPNPLDPPPTQARPEGFYNKKNPPKDDAPIEDLLDYWQHQSQNYNLLAYNIQPSERALSRILREIRKDPLTVVSYLNVMSDSTQAAEVVKEIYNSGEGDPESRSALKKWLKYNSPDFSSELIPAARGAGDKGEYVSNQEELLAIGRNDWASAKPMVDRLYNDPSQPTSQVLARWVLYRRALAENDLSDIDRYRGELQAIVENRQATDGQRDLAFDALVREKEWSGRDDWYFSLLEDETLADLRVNGSGYTGLTTLIIYSAPDRYVDKMVELVQSKNPAVRAAAVRNLGIVLSGDRPESIRALLPWLENPKWAKDYGNTRSKLISALQTVKMPESVPGLIAALDEKEVRDAPNYGHAANVANTTITNRAMTNTNSAGRPTQITVYPLRSQAITALGTQGDIRAVPALRRVFPAVEQYERSAVVRAILLCNGFSVAEQVDALETTARSMGALAEAQAAARASKMAMANRSYEESEEDEETDEPGVSTEYVGNVSDRAISPQAHMKELLGIQVAALTDVSNDLVAAVWTRISALEKTEPDVADALRKIMLNWKNPKVGLLLLGELKRGKADAAVIVKLLATRRELRETYPDAVSDIRNGVPIAVGISACLLETASDYAAILAAPDAEAKTAMLACSRLIRAKLAPAEVAPLVQSKDTRLAMAAERYLESEDSPESRQIILSLHPNEAKVLGARVAFFNDSKKVPNIPDLTELFSSVDKRFTGMSEYELQANTPSADETRLRKEVMENPELLGIYAYGASFIRIYKDKAVFSWEEDTSRYRERTLEQTEFNNFKGFLAHHHADELTSFLSCFEECESKELLMIGRHGGRRVFVKSSKPPHIFAGLEKIIEELKRPPAKLRYWLEKHIPGLEILFADDNLKAHAVWKNGDDFRLLIADEERARKIEEEISKKEEASEDAVIEEGDVPGANVYEERQKRQYENYAWRHFTGTLGGPVAQPLQFDFIPSRNSLEPAASPGRWKRSAAGIEIRASTHGLFKIVGGKSVAIAGSGFYSQPVVTPNGRWVIATAYGGEERMPGLVRINLLTGRQFKVASGELQMATAVAFVPSINRVLLRNPSYHRYHEGEDESSDTFDGAGSYFWLDPESGVVQKAPGDLRPLGQQNARPLQPTATPFEFWAAIPDARKEETSFGVYDSRTFAFKSILKLPRIMFNSESMWVDERLGKLYFVYQGHLLAVPVRTQSPVR